MKERKIRYIIKGVGENCYRCGVPMERREHKERPSKNWFYTEWDICKNIDCRHSVQHYEKYKSSEWQENERMENHFNSIKDEPLKLFN